MEMDTVTKRGILDFIQNQVSLCKVLVVGDVMLDRYFYGSVTRISPEAPVPINRIEQQRDTLGGAANVAHNLAKLGCQVWLAGVIGEDYHGKLLLRKMKKFGIKSDGIIEGRNKTTTKVRVLGDHQQMIRLDFEETEAISDGIEKKILDSVERCIKDGITSIILSDYGKGVCTESLCQSIICLANEYNVCTFIDPKGKNWDKYRNAMFITPNVKEVSVVVGRDIPNEDFSLRKAAEQIMNEYCIDNVIITRSEKGMTYYSRNKEFTISTVAKEVFDVSGAGDTVISVLAAGVAGKMKIELVTQMANFAASIEVGKLGTYAVSREDIIEGVKNLL